MTEVKDSGDAFMLLSLARCDHVMQKRLTVEI